MSQWTFVMTAYGIVLFATAMLVALSWAAMRRGEANAEAIRGR